MLLGCIGDDFTGSSDLANTLAKQGMHTVLYSGVPNANAQSNVEAGVVALKTRSVEPDEAIEKSIAALRWLQSQGCRQFFFKYCSTFDSTAKGNIGPVAEALADELGASQVVVCPAFPGTGRSLYQGHLFVNDQLLSVSGMQNHPITPMLESDIRLVMQAQCKSSVGHVSYADVARGAANIKSRMALEEDSGHLFMVVDAISDEDLMVIGEALDDAKLVTGGSGVALGLPANYVAAGDIKSEQTEWLGQSGKAVVLSGSCSVVTCQQVSEHKHENPAFQVHADDVISGVLVPQQAVDWVLGQNGVPLLYSSAIPEEVAKSQTKHSQETCSQALEQFFASVSQLLVAAGVSKLIVAGGETSGAVVEGLNLSALNVGPEIDPGVPALLANENLVLALKSGNFGAPNFFFKAAQLLNSN